jgi:CRISPR-associated protein Csx14
MSDPEPTICVNVDPCNPGQFFACCGLLELADRLWQGAEGWFDGDSFHVASGGCLDKLLAILVMDPPEQLVRLPSGLDVKALLAPLRFSFDGGATAGLILDAWMTVKTEKGKVIAVANPPWNFWSGQQTPLRIWVALRLAAAEQLTTFEAHPPETLFAQRQLLSGRFGFDPGPAWTALDVGFSPNEQKMEVASSPVVELLAAVGLQRFRPQLSQDRASFTYATWGQPLAPPVAAVAATGVWLAHPARRFRGFVVSRGSYAALGYSTHLRGASDE